MSKTSTEALKAIQSGMATRSGNIKRGNTINGTGFDTYFVGSGSGTLDAIKTRSMTAGTMVSTNCPGDIAIAGGLNSGLLPVRDTNTNEIGYTSATTFRPSKNGNLVDPYGRILLAWKLDSKGNIPVDHSSTDSLSEVNVGNLVSDPQQTKTVWASMNLNAGSLKLKAPGITFAVPKTALNANLTGTDPIAWGSANGGTLQKGDSFIMDSNGQKRTFVYGGVTMTPDCSQMPMFKATSASGMFNFAADPLNPVANEVVENDGITFKLEGAEAKTLRVSKDAKGDGTDNKFNSLTSLCTALNHAGNDQITARISNNRLIVSPVNGNKGVTFTDVGPTNFIGVLGLSDIAPAATDRELWATLGIADPGPAPDIGTKTFRFATLSDLRAKVNSVKTDAALGAEDPVSEGRKLDVGALDATKSFQVSAHSMGKHSMQGATLGDGTPQGRATITITSSNHGLQAGDFVNITGALIAAGGIAPEGRYMVTGADSDQFTINLQCDPGGIPALAAADALPVANITWEKIAGQKYESLDVNAVTSDHANGMGHPLADGNGSVIINIGAANVLGGVGAGAGAIAKGDVVYISGIGNAYTVGGNNNISVPDGYYVAQDITVAGTIIIEAANLVNAPAMNARHTAIDVGRIHVQKVGTLGSAVAAGANTARTVLLGQPISMNVLEYVPVAVGAVPRTADGTVRVYLSHNNYNVGDYITLSQISGGGLANRIRFGDGNAPATIDMDLSTPYKVVYKDGNSNYVDIKVADVGAPTVVMPSIAQYANVTTVDAVGTGNIPRPANTTVNANFGAFRLDTGTSAMRYFGFNTIQDEHQIDATYNPANSAKSLASGSQNQANNTKGNNIFALPINDIVDSLGNTYRGILHLAKLSDNTWTCEFAIGKDANGDYPAVTTGRTDGVVATGVLSFNNQGALLDAGLLENAINIQWTNGAAPSNITINWKPIKSAITNVVTQRGVTQYKGNTEEHLEGFSVDGNKYNVLRDFSFDRNGVCSVSGGGVVRSVYKLAIGRSANQAGLEEGENGLMLATDKSGQIVIGEVGESGRGEIVPGSIMLSNSADYMSELLGLKDESDAFTANIRAASTVREHLRTFLAETK